MKGFFLTWVSNPFIYEFLDDAIRLFYHPLYVLFGGDIAALRQATY